VTNDGRLRRECAVEKVPVLWGLEAVALLVDVEELTPAAAEEIGRAIQRANPKFITDHVLSGFLDRVGIGAAAKREPGRKRRKGGT